MGMIDREKVIKGLAICTTRPCYCTDCPYKPNCYLDSQEVMEDALSLLKEQEPKRGKWVRLTGMAPPEYHGHKVCSLCNCFAPYDPIHPWKEILPKYCPGCGAKMEGETDE